MRESDEKPGDAWVLVAEIRCDGVDGKIWRRIATAVPVVCVVCGNQYSWAMDHDRCPYCYWKVNSGI